MKRARSFRGPGLCYCLHAAFTRYAAAQSEPPAELAAALGRFERDAQGTDAREARRAAGSLGNLLMDELAAGTRRASGASERLGDRRIAARPRRRLVRAAQGSDLLGRSSPREPDLSGASSRREAIEGRMAAVTR
jgi:hypothetical protein